MTERIKVHWTSPEIEHDVKGVMAFSPDKETAILLMVMATCLIAKNCRKFKTQGQKDGSEF
jgi:2,3-di-O-geranylgeranylglyceryl phosphate reductase (EC 1.3.99.-)